MTRSDHQKLLSGELLEADTELSLAELCTACEISEAEIIELVEEGVVEPQGRRPSSWRFQAISLRRIRISRNLQKQLGVNAPGAALALDLLEEVEALRARLQRLEG
jgi:chaperone modulatory protein CbpM